MSDDEQEKLDYAYVVEWGGSVSKRLVIYRGRRSIVVLDGEEAKVIANGQHFKTEMDALGSILRDESGKMRAAGDKLVEINKRMSELMGTSGD